MNSNVQIEGTSKDDTSFSDGLSVAQTQDVYLKQPRKLEGSQLRRAQVEAFRRWTINFIRIFGFVVYGAQFEEICKAGKHLKGWGAPLSAAQTDSVSLIAWIAPPIGVLFYVLVNRYTIMRSWEKHSGDLHSNMRRDCADSFVHALRNYVKLKRLSELTLLGGAVFLYILCFNATGIDGTGDDGSTPFENLSGQQLVLILNLIAFLGLSWWLGYGVFHPGPHIIKAILWLNIQLYEEQAGSEEKNRLILEDQMKIREDRPWWYLKYEITGTGKA